MTSAIVSAAGTSADILLPMQATVKHVHPSILTSKAIYNSMQCIAMLCIDQQMAATWEHVWESSSLGQQIGQQLLQMTDWAVLQGRHETSSQGQQDADLTSAMAAE